MKLLGTVTVETRAGMITGTLFDNVWPRACEDGKIWSKGTSTY